MSRGPSSGRPETSPPRSSFWGYLASAWCVLFAALHVYWAFGGAFGLASSAGADLAAARPAWFVVVGLWLVPLLLLVGAGLGVVLARSRVELHPRLAVLVGGLIGAVLMLRGVGLEVVLLTDAQGVATAVGPDRTRASLVGWNPWFIAGGLVFVLAAVAPGRKRSTRAPSAVVDPE